MIVSFGLITALSHTARPDAPKNQTPKSGQTHGTAASDPTCQIYSLSGLGSDPQLGAWLSETIPLVIQPESWAVTGGAGRLSYYAPGKILVVYQNAAVHAKLEAFLKNFKKALPSQEAARGLARENSAEPPRWSSGFGLQGAARNSLGGVPAVVPAQHATPSSPKAAKSVPAKDSSYLNTAPSPVRVSESVPAKKFTYPVPAPRTQPKHLFHFIIRYEGEGVIDASVVKLFKVLYGDESPGKNAPLPPTPVPGLSYSQSPFGAPTNNAPVAAPFARP
jgi:hypothetical protein